MATYDVIIIGAGPAGLTAGIYCAQAGLNVLTLEEMTLGGEMLNIEKIENYPGFSDGVPGAQLGAQMMTQASVAAGAALSSTTENRASVARGESDSTVTLNVKNFSTSRP